MGAVGLWLVPGLARGWILGWVRSSNKGMKTGDRFFFMLGVVFVAGRGLPGLGVCMELCVRTHLGHRPQHPTSSCALVTRLSPLIKDG